MGRFEGWDLASPSNVHRAMARRGLLQPVRYQAQRRQLDPYSGTLNHPAPHKIAKAHKVSIILDTSFTLLLLIL